MTLREQIDALKSQGYNEVLAQAKVVHDVVLLANPVEQMFTEKLLSLLRHGVVSNRPKDIFDLYYLSEKVSLRKLRGCVKEFIYDSKRCRANDKADVVRMLEVIFSARPFLRRLANAKANWLQVEPSVALTGIMHLVNRL